jgi:hypothetical protein
MKTYAKAEIWLLVFLTSASDTCLELHAATALAPEKEPLVLTEEKAEWDPKLVRTQCSGEYENPSVLLFLWTCPSFSILKRDHHVSGAGSTPVCK